ncbi:hypothetical protein HDU98_002656 [Podochytrium sp. JEL0797]|nr:hypothetical protein HDU98_002656 [Podochytrium sp. JEL0797]
MIKADSDITHIMVLGFDVTQTVNDLTPCTKNCFTNGNLTQISLPLTHIEMDSLCLNVTQTNSVQEQNLSTCVSGCGNQTEISMVSNLPFLCEFRTSSEMHRKAEKFNKRDPDATATGTETDIQFGTFDITNLIQGLHGCTKDCIISSLPAGVTLPLYASKAEAICGNATAFQAAFDDCFKNTCPGTPGYNTQDKNYVDMFPGVCPQILAKLPKKTGVSVTPTPTTTVSLDPILSLNGVGTIVVHGGLLALMFAFMRSTNMRATSSSSANRLSFQIFTFLFSFMLGTFFITLAAIESVCLADQCFKAGSMPQFRLFQSLAIISFLVGSVAMYRHLVVLELFLEAADMLDGSVKTAGVVEGMGSKNV